MRVFAGSIKAVMGLPAAVAAALAFAILSFSNFNFFASAAAISRRFFNLFSSAIFLSLSAFITAAMADFIALFTFAICFCFAAIFAFNPLPSFFNCVTILFCSIFCCSNTFSSLFCTPNVTLFVCLDTPRSSNLFLRNSCVRKIFCPCISL